MCSIVIVMPCTTRHSVNLLQVIKSTPTHFDGVYHTQPLLWNKPACLYEWSVLGGALETAGAAASASAANAEVCCPSQATCNVHLPACSRLHSYPLRYNKFSMKIQ